MPSKDNIKLKRLMIGLPVILVVVAFLFAVPFLLADACYYDNPRFMISKDDITVNYHIGGENYQLGAGGSGYSPQEKKDEIWRNIVINVTDDQSAPLHTHKVNLFRIDYAKLREAIANSSTYRAAEIERTLPNKLSIIITPRVPVALLQVPNYVCDREGMVMRRNAVDIPIDAPYKTPPIPQIVGLKTGDARRVAFLEGKSINAEVLPALQLIDIVAQNRDYGLRLHKINLMKPDVMSILCTYRPNNLAEERRWLVELPTDARLSEKLMDLNRILREKESLNFNYIRLIFENSAVQGRISEQEMAALWRLEGIRS